MQTIKTIGGRFDRARVHNQKQLDRALAEIEEPPGIVLYTLLQ